MDRLGFISHEDSIFTQCNSCNKFAKGKVWKSEVYFPMREGMTMAPKNTYSICGACAKDKEKAKEIMESLLEKDDEGFIDAFCHLGSS